MKLRYVFYLFVLPAMATHAPARLSAAEISFRADIRPLLDAYCFDCHAGSSAEANVDYEKFVSLDDVRGGQSVWRATLAMLKEGQMPPQDAQQPTEDERNRLETWILGFLRKEAEATAGDPGPLVARRLNNEEYNYTTQDLTGIDSLDPTEEFPIDGAGGEGFINTGAGQSMSPAMVEKYLGAAKQVASHAVLLPSGIEFSAGTSRLEWRDERVRAIRDFYDRFTDTKEIGASVAGAGQVASTGGAIALGPYLRALHVERDRLLRGETSIEQIASEHALHAKYLGRLWQALSAPTQDGDSPWMAEVRKQWTTLSPNKVEELAEDIEQLSLPLWKFNPVGQFTEGLAQKAWMEPVTPPIDREEFRLKLAKGADDDVVVYLIADELGDRSEVDSVVWRQARLEFVPSKTAAGSPSSQVLSELPAESVVIRDVEWRNQSGEIEQLKGDPVRFGKHPSGKPTEASSLCVRAPRVLELRLPGELADGAELVVVAELPDPELPETSSGDGRVWVDVRQAPPKGLDRLQAFRILARSEGTAKERLNVAATKFRELFPPVLCYSLIIPVDEVVTLVLFYREDQLLRQLVLDEKQSRELDRLWGELIYVAEEPIALSEALEQMVEFGSQTSEESANFYRSLQAPAEQRAEEFRRRRRHSEPLHVEAVLRVAEKAWRRPLTAGEQQSIREFYSRLRADQTEHDPAIRLTLTRVLTSPVFLYRFEQPAEGAEPGPISGGELASRLSYFLWSSMPDAGLRALAESGRLVEDEVLLAETRRMLKDARMRRLAIQFACQWLHVRDFRENNDKNERVFPEFAELRDDMDEETVLFFDDMLRNNGSVLDILAADHTFVNKSLARHYGMSDVSGEEWRRVDGIAKDGRGGVLGMASFLASQSGASRTSPILRGNWVYETLLGERLPRPPANVPLLPDDLPEGLTARQLIELHSSDSACAKCHVKIDAYGFALERFDAIGRHLGDPELNVRGTLQDGTEIEGIDGLRHYLMTTRRDDFVRQFCRKLLGFALGRETQLSDELLLDKMQKELEANDFRCHVAIEAIVTSPQFRNIRGIATATTVQHLEESAP